MMTSEAPPPGAPVPESGSGSEGASLPPAGRPASPGAKGSWIGWTLLVLLILGVTGAALIKPLLRVPREPLPPPIKAAPSFVLTDDKGTSFSSTQLAGEPYVIDFIFTRCGTQCPMMTVQMRDLQNWLKKRGHGNIRLVSVSVDPAYDTPEVMADYAQRFAADRSSWVFLTGAKEEIYPMIQTGFMLGVEENKGVAPADQFIHSAKFVLVDAEGQIRGFYDAGDEEQMKQLRRVIESFPKKEDAKS